MKTCYNVKKYHLLFLCCLFFAHFNTFGQGWQPIRLHQKLNYGFADAVVVANTLWVDSAKVIGNDSLFYLNRIIKRPDTSYSPIFFYYNQPQFLQMYMQKKANGVFICKDSQEFTLHSFAHLNENWIWDSTQNISATIIKESDTLLWGQMDSLKTILLSVNDTLILSKSFGFLKFRPYWSLENTYQLMGVENPNLGVQVPKYPYYALYPNLGLGDVCIFREEKVDYGAQQYSTCDTRWDILQQNMVNDTNYLHVTMKVSCTDNFGVHTWVDTSIVKAASYPQNTYFEDAYPNELVQIVFGTPEPINAYGFVMLKENGDKIINGLYEVTAATYPIANKSLYASFVYKEIYRKEKGLFERKVSLFEHTENDLLLCYQKVGDSVQCPFSSANISVQKPEIHISPNPNEGIFVLSFSNFASNKGAKLEIYSILGEKVFEKENVSEMPNTTINMRGVNPGMYFIQLKIGNLIWREKMIKYGEK